MESLLNKAIDPSNKYYNSETIKTIVRLIDGDPVGIPAALRLIAHRFQSPQEREALNALYLLDILTKQCGPSFISEVGKFKFLNEMIKVLSPKYLGDQSTPAVKRKCIQLLHKWQREYSTENPKFTETYNMLCTQGIITPGDVESYTNGVDNPSTPVSRGPNIFDRSAQSAKLSALLRSRDRADVEEANRIIKNIVEEDQKRMATVTQRNTEMEALKNNTVLLREMTNTLMRGGSSAAELDVMIEVAENIRKARSMLYGFSLVYDDNNIDVLVEIAQICDSASTVLSAYEQQLATHTSGLSAPFGPRDACDKPVVDDLLSQDLKELGLDVDNNAFQTPALAAIAQSLQQRQPCSKTVSQVTNSKYDELADIFSSAATPLPVSSMGSPHPTSLRPLVPSAVATTHPVKFLSISSNDAQLKSSHAPQATATATVSTMFNDLDVMGRRMLGLTPSESTAISTTDESSLSNHTLETAIGEQANQTPSLIDPVSSESKQSQVVDLSILDVPFPSIHPHPVVKDPVIVYPSASHSADTGVQLALHYTGNEPAADVLVFVAVVTSRCASPVTDVVVRFGVTKPLHLRQLPPSGQSLSAYSPFLPTGAVNQVILVYDPVKMPTLTFKFQLSFNINHDVVLESGEVQVPVT